MGKKYNIGKGNERKWWFKNPLYFIITLLVISIAVGLISVVCFGAKLDDVVGFIQILVLPLSLGATAFTISKNNKNQEISIELEKIKMTNNFISDFRKAMSTLSTHSQIKYEYYSKNPSVKELFEKIKDHNKLEFNKEFIQELLPKKLTYEKLNEYITITKELGNANIDAFVSICSDLGVMDSYSTPTDFHLKTRQYDENVERNKTFYITTKKAIQKQGGNVQVKIEELNKEYSDRKKKTNYLFAKAIREDHGKILNDMECILFNVNFDMLNYEQLYHLVIDPFKSYMTNFYFDICISVINGKKEERLIFSNITEFYEIMTSLEQKYIDSRKLDKENYLEIERKTDKVHKKSIH